MRPESPLAKHVPRLCARLAWLLSIASCTSLDDSVSSGEAGVAVAPDAMALVDGAAWMPWSLPPGELGTGMDAGAQPVTAMPPTTPGGGAAAQPGGSVPVGSVGGSGANPAAGGANPSTTSTQPDAAGTTGSCAATGTCRTDSGMVSTPNTPACTANVTCTPLTACKSGRTSCTSGTSSCVESGDQSDGAPCSGGVCSKGHCCPSGQSWTGSGCAVVCSTSQRLCGSTCIAPDVPCSNACPSGRVLCNGQCVVGDCCSNAQCGRCKKCSSNQCQNQTTSEDLGNECYEGPCDTGFCNGQGDCGHLAAGTVYCEVTRLITCSGGESFTDMQCENWCLPSCKPTNSSCRGPATCNECHPGLGFTKCASSTSISECGSNGRWLAGVACGSGQVCRGDNITASCTSP